MIIQIYQRLRLCITLPGELEQLFTDHSDPEG